MKLAILGGGGFRVPLVYQALATGQAGSGTLIDELWLYDTDPARLVVIENVLRQLPGSITPHATTRLDDALDGADFVFSAIRVGGLAGRIADERAAIEAGLVGQETTGPGGLAYALRTIPVARHVAGRVLALAPEAYLINFTNPAGIITEAMQELLGDRAIGICDTPSGLGSRLAGLFGVPADEVRLDYAGLNHLGWLRSAHYRDRDLVKEVLAPSNAALLDGLEEAQVMGPDWLRVLGLLPNEYLYYFYRNREARRAGRAGGTRGEFLRAQQDAFYAAAAARPEQALAAWRRALSEREASYMAEARPAGAARPASGGGYEYVALGLMQAIAAGEPRTMILNVRNRDTLPGLPPDAVVEVPCRVDGAGPRPLAPTQPGGAELGLLQQVKAVERLTIRAAVDRDPDLAVQALALHPLVDSVAVARDLLAAYRRVNPALFAR
jgi:6-phospho-beta-glucosidase